MILDNDMVKARLLSDLSMIGLPMNEVDLFIRPYSKTFYGRYYPVYDEDCVKPRVFVYPYEEDGELMDYNVILSSGGIHEMCHHIEYTDSSWVRLKGVAHDVKFWKLYSYYVMKAYRYGVLGGDLSVEEIIGNTVYETTRTNQRIYNSGVVSAYS